MSVKYLGSHITETSYKRTGDMVNKIISSMKKKGYRPTKGGWIHGFILSRCLATDDAICLSINFIPRPRTITINGWFGIKRKKTLPPQRMVDVGTLSVRNTPWGLKIRGEEYLDRMLKFAEDVAAEFGINVDAKLVSREPGGINYGLNEW